MPKKKQKSRIVTIKILRIDDPVNAWKRASCGLLTGLSFTEWLATTFDANEMLPQTRKLTDESILQALAKEFPRRPSVLKLLNPNHPRTINHYRNLHNKGKLTGTAPDKPSRRWTMRGEVANGRSGLPLKKAK
jgi:hypothetical protein